jgi:hypothetical protein
MDGKEEYYEDEDVYYEEEDVYVPEYGAYQRTGMGMSTSLRGAKNPYEKFKIILDAVLEKTSSALQLSREDRTTIFEFSARAPNNIFKNAACFVLGYIGSGGGRGLSDASLKKAFAGIDKVQQTTGAFDGIEQADVIRYSVYWINNISTN